ncbi:glycerophosphodiester phosphodiesterase [Enterococcus faecalis]|nr:glycerophosphodiester phosphodiesterase [Enterococcus faecalis]
MDMAIEQIKETDTLNQGRIKINAILDQSNASTEKVDAYQEELKNGINDAKKIADTAGKEAIRIAEEAGNQANETANQAMANSQTAINTSNQAVSTANNNKQEFDALRNDFDKLVGEAGDSNPEIVQARTDTQGVTRTTLAARLQSDFNDRMTKTEGVSLLSGITNVKVPMDFNGKTAGNTATNANKYFTDVTAKSLKKPKDTWNEVSQTDYNKLVSRNDSGVSSGSTQNGIIPQQLGEFNALEAAKRLVPQLFKDLNLDESVKLLKNNFVSFTISERVKASSPNNKTIKVSTYIESTDSWSTQSQEPVDEYKDLSIQVTDNNFITSDGIIYIINYTDPSNGVTTSTLDVDYVSIQFEISIDAQSVLEKSGFIKEKRLNEHIEDNSNPHKVTSAQVGLGNVDNYNTATQSSAEKGESNTEFMTPFTTKKYYLNETKTHRQRWKEGLNWIAHRGNNTEYPENSIPAFKTVRRHWGIETDIQVTSDGQWVVMHDETVDRTTNGTGKVSSMTLSQFRNLRIDAGANVSKLSDEERIPPTLDDYLSICKQINKVPIIEIKNNEYSTANYALLKDTLNLYGFDEFNCVIGSFSYAVLNVIRSMYPNMELHYFVNEINTNVINELKNLSIPAVCSCIFNNASVNSTNVKNLHSLGMKIGTWTVPENKFADMIKLGIDYITTNSLSGNQKYAKLSYQNGFVDNQGITDASYVEELVGGGIHINFNVEKGGNTQNTVIANLPDWAIPLKSQYSQCGIRTSSGVALGTFDIRGRTAPAGVVAGTLSVGLNWSGRSSWAAGSTVYAV